MDLAENYIPAPAGASEEADEPLAMLQQIARLQALLEASRQVHGTISLHGVLMTALRIAVRELEVDGAAVTSPRLQYGTMPPEPWTGCSSFPLQGANGTSVGDMVIACTRPLSMSEQDFLEGLALQTAVAVQNARFHERDVEWARVQQDLDAARALQRSLLPARMPEVPGYGLALRSTTCFEVGGDYADILSLPSGAQTIIVADVAGKGLASAIVSTAFRAAFRAMALAELPLAEIAVRMNQQHWSEGAEARRKYVTAILVRLDPGANTLEVVNAGHNPGMLILSKAESESTSNGDDTVCMLQASGPPIGMLPGMEYTAETHPFPPGSRLLLYSDGLTEVFDSGDEEFGEERLLDCYRACHDCDCETALGRLWQAVADFSGGTPQADDMTALAVCRWPCADSHRGAQEGDWN